MSFRESLVKDALTIWFLIQIFFEVFSYSVSIILIESVYILMDLREFSLQFRVDDFIASQIFLNSDKR